MLDKTVARPQRSKYPPRNLVVEMVRPGFDEYSYVLGQGSLGNTVGIISMLLTYD